MVQLFTDNAATTVAVELASGATSLTVATGDGAKFPSPSGGDTAVLTLTQPGASETSWEDVVLTARSGDVLTVTRSVAVVWPAGSKCELRVTSAYLNSRASAGANTDITSLKGLTIGQGASGYTSNTVYGINSFKNPYSVSIKNVLIGTETGYFTPTVTTTLLENVMVGYRAGYSLRDTTGAVLIGMQAGYSATTAHHSVAVGASAMSAGATDAVAIGYQSGNNATGAGNVTIGSNCANANAGTTLSSGTNNTIIGTTAGNVGTGSNNTVVGYNARAAAAADSNVVTLGNSSVATLRCQVTSITALSDERDKANIWGLPFGLDFINALRPIEFTWATRDGAKTGTRAAGFTAQDLLRVQQLYAADALNLVDTHNPDQFEARYGNLLPVLVKAIQDLSAQVAALQKKVG